MNFKTNITLNLLLILIVSTMTTTNSCKTTSELSTVKVVDLNKYIGTWYEIARLPNSFEKNMKCVTANYSFKKNGKIKVLNRGFKTTKGKFSKATGTAKIHDKNFPGRLKVTFFWPFYGDYYIIHLDKNYKYALVGAPSRSYLWILSRTKVLSDNIFNELIEIAKNKGFKTENMIKTIQDCNE